MPDKNIYSLTHAHAQSCPTLCNPMDCSLPGYSVHGIFQARILLPSPGELPNPGTELMAPVLEGGFFTTEPQGKPSHCGSFSCCGAQALRHAGSVVATHQLSNTGPVVMVHRLSCHSMWDLPGPEIELMSPTFAGGFFATEPPGRPKRRIPHRICN